LLRSNHLSLQNFEMKIKTIERSLDEVLPVQGAPPVRKRNLDPALHPFQRAREYNRAKTAAKLDRMFAKPFVASLEGHIDGVYCTAKDPRALSCVASGSGDGAVVVWSLAAREALHKIKAHKGQVADICFAAGSSGTAESSSRAQRIWSNFDGNAEKANEDEVEADHENVRRSARLLSCSKDKTVKMWATTDEGSSTNAPLKVWTGRNGFKSVVFLCF
jgi:WD repeat and SOF domain-containing protein 1